MATHGRMTALEEQRSPRSPRLKVIAFAYACEPHKGSEPGVGWNVVRRLATYHDVWVITRANNRAPIEEELQASPVQGLSFIYHDLPYWLARWKRGAGGVQLYSYLWQLTAVRPARRVHESVRFDASHHVTFVKYWAPSGAAFLGLPFVWGPVGGADGLAPGFWGGLSRRSKVRERLRKTLQSIGERDPLLRITARRAAMAFGTTEATCERLLALGVARVELLQAVALDLREIGLSPEITRATSERLEFVSIGRLEGQKGHHVALAAFARAAIPGARYTIVGDGTEMGRLKRLAHVLGVGHQVEFTGALPRPEAMKSLARADVMIQPSLHESGGSATLEAMAHAIPVVALRQGGPAVHVTSETGILIEPTSEEAVVEAMADALRTLAADPELRGRMGRAGLERLRTTFSWQALVAKLAKALTEAAVSSRETGNRSSNSRTRR